jgi:hypothetical protein
MTRRSDIQQRRLEGLESEFRLALPRVLTQCAAGRWGLFGQNYHIGQFNWWYWPEAEQLKDMAREIQLIREDFGQPNLLVERFLYYCSLRGSNVHGEPKLAQVFLDEIDAGLSAS